MFLDPAVAGAAGREVGRSPRGGVAGLEPRRITGEGRGGAESLPGGERRGRGQRRGPAGGSGGVRQGGRREARSAPPRPGSPGVRLRRGGRAGGGDRTGPPPESPGNAARQLANVRRLLGLPLAAANFFPLGKGAGGLGAGPATRAPGAACSVRPQWVPPGGGGKARLSFSGAARSESPGTFSVAGILQPWTCLSLPCSPRRTFGAFSSHLWFCAGRGNCKMPEYRNHPRGPAGLQRVLRPGGGGSGPASCRWRLQPDCTWSRGGGGGGGGHAGGRRGTLAGGARARFSAPSPPRLSKQGLSAGACRAG
nr:translation initiation factor IF-2-like [Chlorocebus sabaeus]